MKPGYIIAAGVGAVVVIIFAATRIASAGSNQVTQVYKGYTFNVAHFSDWYNGTGWRFMFVNQSPDGSPTHTNQWMGVFQSQAEAIASAQYMIDGG